jgi:hypothetical protein
MDEEAFQRDQERGMDDTVGVVSPRRDRHF